METSGFCGIWFSLHQHVKEVLCVLPLSENFITFVRHLDNGASWVDEIRSLVVPVGSLEYQEISIVVVRQCHLICYNICFHTGCTYDVCGNGLFLVVVAVYIIGIVYFTCFGAYLIYASINNDEILLVYFFVLMNFCD